MATARQLRKTKKFILNQIRVDLKERAKEILRPKPKFMPWWLWKFLIKKLLILD